MLLPVLIAAGAGVAAWKQHKKKDQGMTPVRKQIFEATLKDPKLSCEQIEVVAKGLDKAGLKAEAKELRKRCAILSAPPKTIEARKTAFKKAMNSTDQAAVKKVAAAFHSVGHYKAAEQLRAYAKGLFSHPAGKVSAAATVAAEE